MHVHRSYNWYVEAVAVFIVTLAAGAVASAQAPAKTATAEQGSQTAKAGFRNEDAIAAKFNDWRTDRDAAVWLAFMGYKSVDILDVAVSKPSGEKADIVVKVRTAAGEKAEGVSIKLVSGANGFNQIDKRWLRQYAAMWTIPSDIEQALMLYVGEKKPVRPSRDPRRMFINEFDPGTQKRIVDFFTTNKERIVADLLSGEGESSAGWMLVALRSAQPPRWVLRSMDHTIRYFSEGPVEITRAGNLKIGRITMQRKGGDGGRETANMLQFKFNPALLFDAK